MVYGDGHLRIQKWGFEYLSGSNQHSNDLQKGECKRVV